MALFKKCPYCGCNLDPGETCDCKKEAVPAPTGTTCKADVELDLISAPIITHSPKIVKGEEGAKR